MQRQRLWHFWGSTFDSGKCCANPWLQSSDLIATHCVTSKCWTSSSLPKSRTAASVKATKWEFNSSIMADRAPVSWKDNKMRSSSRKTKEGEIHTMTNSTTMWHLFNLTFLHNIDLGWHDDCQCGKWQHVFMPIRWGRWERPTSEGAKVDTWYWEKKQVVTGDHHLSS